MQHPFLLFCVIGIFFSFMIVLANDMAHDLNPIIRFLGYLVAVVMAAGVFWLVLYWYFDINLLNLA